jgi:hypothetical protein
MPDYSALGSEEFENAKAAPVQDSKRIMTFDYARLKQETGIEKFKFEPSGEDDPPYVFDFLPFPASPKHPKYVKLKKAFGGGAPLDWRLTLVFHRIQTPMGEFKVLCPRGNFGKACPFCERKQELFNENGNDWKSMSKATQDEIKSLNDTERDFFLVLNHADDKVYVMEYSSFFFGDKLKKKMSRSNRGDSAIILAHPGANGHSLEFWIEPANIKDNKGKPVIGPIDEMEFVPRKKAIDLGILDSLPALDEYIVQYSYDELEAMLDGTFFAESDDDDDDDDEEDTQYSGLAEATTENKDDSDDEDDEPAPRRRSRRSRTGESSGEDTPATTSESDAESAGDISPVPSGDEMREERRRRRREQRKAKTAPEDPACPAGGEFGKDIDEFEECDDCPVYEQCEERYNQNKDIPF